MAELVLLAGAADDEMSAEVSYALVPLDTDRVRYLREQMRVAAEIERNNPRFQKLHLDDPDGASFIYDPDFGAEEGPYGALNERIESDADSAVVRHVPVPKDHVHSGTVHMVVRSTSLYWTLRSDSDDQNELWSYEVHSGPIALAWCLVCRPAERASAFSDLIRVYPEQAAEWLDAGVMRSDDGAAKQPLPMITRDMLLPLLEHEDQKIRQTAIAALGRLEVRAARGRS